MQVLSRCPLRVGSILWLPRAGAYAMTVVCKATFRLAPDVSPLADEQEPVIEADTYPAGDETRGLLLASDLVPYKRQPEVLLVGHAYAPQGGHVGRLVARLTVVEMDKAIEVTGDRHFKLDGSLSVPGRFAKMPLCWERAAGGAETSNPAGVPMGPEVRPDGWGRVPVPNLVPLNRLIADRDDVVLPACFGPIAPHWPARLARLPRYAVGFPHHAWHARPLPPDLDPGYFNAAPQDQQVHELLGTERITLENLHPHHPLLTTHLEGVTPHAHVDWGGGGGTFEIPLACDTLLIDTDRGIACITYRGSFSLDHPERAGWVIVTADGLPAAPSREPSPSRDEVREPMPAVPEVLPFVGDAGADIAFEQTGDLDDAETFASEHGAPIPPPRGAGVPAPPAVPPPTPAATPLPLEVPKGPRLGAFRLQSSSERPPSASAPTDAPVARAHGSALDDAPTMDPDEAWLHETADDPSTARPAFRPGVPAPPVPGAPMPPVAGQPAPVPPPPPVPAFSAAPVAATSAASSFRSTWTEAGSAAPVGLPFAAKAAEPPRRAPGEAPDRSAMPFTPSPAMDEPMPRVGSSPALPFGPSPVMSALDEPGSRVGPSPALPFMAAPSSPLAPSAMAPPAPPLGSSPLGLAPLGSSPLAPPPGMTIGEMVAQSRAPVAGPVVGPVSPLVAPASFEPDATMDGLPGEPSEPPPPARLGPLATPEMVAADLGVAPVAPAAQAGEGTEPAAAAPPGPPEPKPLPLDAYPIDRCARIAASIARSRDRVARILETHELEEEVWEALKAHWAAEIKKETERGKTALLRVYDAAYVAQLEDERGPIAIEEYARMVVASERGTAPRTLGALGLPEASMLRIQRVWMGKMQKDPELRRLVRSAVESASEE